LRDVFESDAGSAATLAVVEEEAEDVDDVGPDDWAHGRDLPEDACAIIFVPRAPGAADPDPDADPGVDLGTAATPLELVGTCPGTGSFVFDRCWFTIGTMTMLLHRRDAPAALREMRVEVRDKPLEASVTLALLVFFYLPLHSTRIMLTI
jgi:hypothetical protein